MDDLKMQIAPINPLAQVGASLANHVKDGGKWVLNPENCETVGARHASLAKQMRKLARRASKLSTAADRKMCVSVFGPSQAGKSFLISAIARPTGSALVSNYSGPGGQLDYLKEINPEGHGESTGLVTRFTMDTYDTPEGYPVRLRLLAEIDIVRIIANSFFLDGDKSETPPTSDEMGAHIAAFESRMVADQPGLDLDGVEEIADYVNSKFGNRFVYAQALKSFWDAATKIAPKLGKADRAAFFSIIWGGHEEFTGLYLKLKTTLDTLNHAEIAYCPLAALTPRDQSIIDVMSLYGLMGNGGDQLRLMSDQGVHIDLPRSVITALAAELHLPILEQPWPLFQECDLLDFPGTRTRDEEPLKKVFTEPAKMVPRLFLRGKVAFLFDLYVDSQEISSMLLCIGKGNVEANGLPQQVEEWISQTQGETPEDRQNRRRLLFFVLTMFDTLLTDAGQAGEASNRFERRLYYSLEEKFGSRPDSWAKQWTPEKPFNNCFWARNPKYPAEGIIKYNENGSEVEIIAEREERLATLKAGFVNEPKAQSYFADPEAAWEAAMALNDGGIKYLVENLSKVCSSAIHLEQISRMIRETATEAEQLLRPYYVSDDYEVRLQEKRADADRVIGALDDCFSHHRFGRLHKVLTVNSEDIADRMQRIPPNTRIVVRTTDGRDKSPSVPATAPGTAGARVRPGGGRMRPGGNARAATSQPAHVSENALKPTEPQINLVTREQFQAETATTLWFENLESMQNDTRIEGRYGIDASSASSLIGELSLATTRIGLKGSMIEKLKSLNFALTSSEQSGPASILCASVINDFVSQLGTDQKPESQRPVVLDAEGAKLRTVFTEKPPRFDANDLPEMMIDAAGDRWTDWVHALYAMYEENAIVGADATINLEQNSHLSEILTGLNTVNADAHQ
jgi:hypothetical protein